MKQHYGDYDSAQAALEKASELNPGDVKLWVTRALLLFNHIDRELGTEVLLEAVKTAPDNAELHFRISAFLLATGSISEALYYLQNGLDIDYSKHLLLFEQFPEATNIPRVMDLIQIYGQ